MTLERRATINEIAIHMAISVCIFLYLGVCVCVCGMEISNIMAIIVCSEPAGIESQSSSEHEQVSLTFFCAAHHFFLSPSSISKQYLS